MIWLVKGCPTCKAIELVLRGSRVPKPIAKKIAFNDRIRLADEGVKQTVKRAVKSKVKRKASNYAKKLSKHIKHERAKATKKNGDFKKGMNMGIVMQRAHKCVKKEMRK